MSAGRPRLLVSPARRADQPSLLDLPEVAAACGPRPHIARPTGFEVRSSHQLPGGAEQASTLNEYLATVLVSVVDAQRNNTRVSSADHVWVRAGHWRNVLARKPPRTATDESLHRGHQAKEFSQTAHVNTTAACNNKCQGAGGQRSS